MEQTEKSLVYETFSISGLDCPDCAAHLGEIVGKLQGVAVADVNFTAGKMKVAYNQSVIQISEIYNVVGKLGYQMGEITLPGTGTLEKSRWYSNRKMQITLAAGVVLALGTIFDGADQLIGAKFFYFLTMLIGGYPVAKSGIYSLRQRSMDTNFLMLIAAVGAVAIGEWSEGATVVFLFSLGNALQAYTFDKTRDSLKGLLELAPEEALVCRNGEEKRLPVREVLVGEVFIVKPGERIALDGQVISGLSSVNQAPITGESLPVEKEAGDDVYAGTVNGEGALEVRVSKLAAESTLAQIMQRVEEAQARKAPIAQLVDRFSQYYTPLVILGALLLMSFPPLFFDQSFEVWFYRALVLLVIACPCALVISTPVSIVAALGNASRHGILIKGGNYLEAVGTVKSIAFDKTGTLTTGKLTVTDIEPLSAITKEDLLQITAAIERWSEHPIARAVLTQTQGLPAFEASLFQALPGRGAQATLADGRIVYAGNRRLFRDLGQEMSSYEAAAFLLEEQGKTVLFIGTEESIYGLIAVADQARESSREAVDGLRALGIQAVTMLTGDNERVAQSTARNLGIDSCYSDLLPEDKVAALGKISEVYGATLMVGDGINDAPALAAAHIGVAMGAAGSDAAIEVADIALLADDLHKLAYVIKLSRSTMTIIKQNITFSIGIKALFILGTCLGIVNLWLAIFADMGASLLVTLNGMRLLKERK